MDTLDRTQKLILDDFGSPLIQQRYIKNVDRGLRDSEKRVIEQYLKPGSKILDIGCGTGRTTIALHNLGFDIVGIDITPEMIANAILIAKEKNLEIRYKVDDATQLHYEDNSQENILFLTNGRTQIPSEKKRFQALDEIYRTLQKGGIFILIFHARHEKDVSFFRIKQWIKHTIIKALGFQIREIDFGDLFFKRNIDNNTIDQTQFMHIANPGKVKNKLISLGFELLFYGRENEIVTENLHDKDNVYDYAPMFAVCRK